MRKGDPITTYTGIDFYVLDPRPEEIIEEDIAHSLSLMCRANGHFKYFYSVAQHSLNCLKEARARGYSVRVQMACLIHDAGEAYISDITRPVKQYLPVYKECESVLLRILFRRFGLDKLTEEEQNMLSDVDDTLLYHEFASMHKRTLANSLPQHKAIFDFAKREPEEVEQEFLKELEFLKEALEQK